MIYRVYPDAKGEWRWSLRSANGDKIADSGEGYKNKEDCLHGIHLVKSSFDAPITELSRSEILKRFVRKIKRSS